jgi:hypothetical protein
MQLASRGLQSEYRFEDLTRIKFVWSGCGIEGIREVKMSRLEISHDAFVFIGDGRKALFLHALGFQVGILFIARTWRQFAQHDPSAAT